MSHPGRDDVAVDERPYDELTPVEQAERRARWSARMKMLREELDLIGEFADAGRAYVGLDEDGRIIRYNPDGTVNEVIGQIEE